MVKQNKIDDVKSLVSKINDDIGYMQWDESSAQMWEELKDNLKPEEREKKEDTPVDINDPEFQRQFEEAMKELEKAMEEQK